VDRSLDNMNNRFHGTAAILARQSSRIDEVVTNPLIKANMALAERVSLDNNLVMTLRGIKAQMMSTCHLADTLQFEKVAEKI